MNHSTSESRRLLSVSPGIVIADITLLTIAIFAGFLGNTRVCFLLRKRSKLRKVPHFLLGSLAANGIFSSLLSLTPRLAMIIIIHFLDSPASAELACYIMMPSGFACGILNAVTLSLMAIDRQDCVLRPFNRRMTSSNIIKVIAASWFGTLVLTSVVIFQSVYHQFEPCGVIPKIKGRDPIYVYVGILTLSFNIASVFIIVITACRIIKRLHSSPLPESSSHHRRQENKLTWLTYKICGVFLVCWLPLFVCFPLAQFGRNSEDTLVSALITLTLSNFNYAVNPVLYYKMLRVRRVNNIPRAAERPPRDIEMNPSNNAQDNVNGDVEVYGTH